MRVFYLLLTVVIVGILLWVRRWFDTGMEKLTDTEVVREGEEHLGNWAGRWANGQLVFRLRRDNTFTASWIGSRSGDTIRTIGYYDIVAGSNTAFYPRLLALDTQRDTFLNLFVAYLTPYDTKVDKVDKMVLSPGGIYDTMSYTFYRVKP